MQKENTNAKQNDVTSIVLPILAVSLMALAAKLAHASPQSASTADLDLKNPDVTAIAQLAKDFSEAIAANDLKRVIDFYSPDVVYMSPGMPDALGKDALAQNWNGMLSSLSRNGPFFRGFRAGKGCGSTPSAGSRRAISRWRGLPIWCLAPAIKGSSGVARTFDKLTKYALIGLRPDGFVSRLGIGYFLWWFSFVLLAVGLFDLADGNHGVESTHSRAALLPR